MQWFQNLHEQLVLQVFVFQVRIFEGTTKPIDAIQYGTYQK